MFSSAALNLQSGSSGFKVEAFFTPFKKKIRYEMNDTRKEETEKTENFNEHRRK